MFMWRRLVASLCLVNAVRPKTPCPCRDFYHQIGDSSLETETTAGFLAVFRCRAHQLGACFAACSAKMAA
jgi:hypothetical protein